MRNHYHLMFLAALMVGLVLSGCRPIGQDDLVRKFVNEGLAYRQHIELNSDGSFVHTVFQSSGNSVSTREARWSLSGEDGNQRIVFNEFKPVVTFKDYAIHRARSVTPYLAEMTVRKGIFGTYRLTSLIEPVVVFVSVN